MSRMKYNIDLLREVARRDECTIDYDTITTNIQSTSF